MGGWVEAGFLRNACLDPQQSQCSMHFYKHLTWKAGHDAQLINLRSRSLNSQVEANKGEIGRISSSILEN